VTLAFGKEERTGANTSNSQHATFCLSAVAHYPNFRAIRTLDRLWFIKDDRTFVKVHLQLFTKAEVGYLFGSSYVISRVAPSNEAIFSDVSSFRGIRCIFSNVKPMCGT
jgi:hypothetical protein